MKKALFIIILFIGVFALFSKTIRAGDCSGVSKCGKWDLGGNCIQNVVLQSKVCFGTTESACYANELPCEPDFCTISNCEWTTVPGDPTPTPGGGGGTGGGGGCPVGTYFQRQDECRNECNAGWQSGGNCGECGNNAQGNPKVCCHKGFCIPEKPQNFSFTCNGNNTITVAWNENPAATSYSLRVNDQSNGWIGAQANQNCATTNPGDVCVNNLPLTPTSYTFPITTGSIYTIWAYTIRTAADVAAKYHLRGSDAVYAAVAVRFVTQLITLDAEQLQRVKKIVSVRRP